MAPDYNPLATLYSDIYYKGSTEQSNTLENCYLLSKGQVTLGGRDMKSGKSKSMDLESHWGFVG